MAFEGHIVKYLLLKLTAISLQSGTTVESHC